MTDQERENVSAILWLAKGYSAENKNEAVKKGDFDRSFRIATNEAKVEEFFRAKGVTVDI